MRTDLLKSREIQDRNFETLGMLQSELTAAQSEVESLRRQLSEAESAKASAAEESSRNIQSALAEVRAFRSSSDSMREEIAILQQLVSSQSAETEIEGRAATPKPQMLADRSGMGPHHKGASSARSKTSQNSKAKTKRRRNDLTRIEGIGPAIRDLLATKENHHLQQAFGYNRESIAKDSV